MKKYKYVVVFGCSFSANQGPVEDATYGDLIAKYIFHKTKLYPKFYNLAGGGGSIQRMHRKVLEWCGENKDKFKDTLIILGMTSIDRFENWSNRRQLYIQLTPGEKRFPEDAFVIPWSRDERTKWFVNFHSPHSSFLQATHYIIGLQLFFKVNNIDHVFFDALMPMEKYWEKFCETTRYEHLKRYLLLFENLVSRENWYKHPEYGSMHELTNENPVMCVSKDNFHPNKEAHKYWAECLIEYLNEK